MNIQQRIEDYIELAHTQVDKIEEVLANFLSILRKPCCKMDKHKPLQGKLRIDILNNYFFIKGLLPWGTTCWMN